MQIINFPNYSITENGDIFKLNGELLSKQTLNSGYYIVHLYSNNKRKACTIHRLVALHFISNPENKKYVNHLDGNKLNNAKSNLAWSTHSENMLHAFKTGLMGDTNLKAAERMRELGKKHCSAERMIFYTMQKIVPVIQMGISGNIINAYPSISEAQRATGAKNIHKVLSGKNTYSGGYKWELKNTPAPGQSADMFLNSR